MKRFSIQPFVLLFLLVTLTGCSTVNLGNQNIMSLAWYQSSGECRALYYQAFNTGKSILENDLKSGKKGKKRAVVVDIDETILDNSPASAREATDNKGYPYQWNEWITEARADATPGAVDFLNFADSKGIDVFYITNRLQDQSDPTMANLKKDGFPQVDPSHMFFQDGTNDKESRRQFVEKDHRVVLFCGDNLNDLEQLFWIKSASDRASAVDQEKDKFGTQFLVLPNPVYGDWEGSIYGYNYGMTAAEKDAARKSALKVYEEAK